MSFSDKIHKSTIVDILKQLITEQTVKYFYGYAANCNGLLHLILYCTNHWIKLSFLCAYHSLLWYIVTELPPTHHITTVLWPFFRDHPGEPVPEENFWILCCKGRLTEVDTPTIRLGATPSGLTNAHLHHPPFFTGWMPFLQPNQQCQSTEGN